MAGVIQRFSLGTRARSFGLLTILVALLGLIFASPAFANQGEVGAEYSDGISGVIREDGEPLENVRITVEGMGYSAEVLTDADGRWRIGVPVQGDYRGDPR